MAQDLKTNIVSREVGGRVVYDVRMTITGGDRHFKGGFATRKEAATYRDKLNRAKNARALLRQRTLKLPELVEMWMEATRADKVGSTDVGYRNALENHIKPELNVPINKVSLEVLKQFQRELPGRLAKSSTTGRATYKRVVDMVRAALKWANRPDVRLIEENPLRDVPIAMPKKGPARRPTTPEAFSDLMDATQGKQSQLLWFMLGYTGARKGEITALLWSDINFVLMEISISKISTPESRGSLVEDRVKMDQIRTLPMDEDLGEALLRIKHLRSAKETDPVFPAPRKGGTISHGTIDKWWIRDCKAAGIPCGKKEDGYVIHSLRHMYTTVLIEAGNDIKAVSRLLGHSTVATTQETYEHVSDSRKRKAASAIGSVLRAPKKSD